MVQTQEIQHIWLDKEDFNKKTWKKLLDLFGVDEDIKDRTFSIDADALQAQLERKKAGIANQCYIEGWNDCMMRVKSMVSTAPAIDLAPAHGRWVHLGGDEWFCSACGFVITTEGSWEKPTKKYCEDCGAKMEQEVR